MAEYYSEWPSGRDLDHLEGWMEKAEALVRLSANRPELHTVSSDIRNWTLFDV